MGDNSFRKFKLSSLKGRYVVLFFYPMDFSFVCMRPASPIWI